MDLSRPDAAASPAVTDDGQCAVSRLPTDRRAFLAGCGGAVAALTLPFRLVAAARVSVTSRPAPDLFAPNAWLRITSDNRVTVIAEKPELGQGSWTYSAMMVAEELEVDWAIVQVEQAPTIPSIYKGLRTGGSGGVVASYDPLRRVGAQAREMLREAAARRWNADRRDCVARLGVITHTPSRRHLTYGELVADAARLRVPEPRDIALKPASEFTSIGQPLPRIDLHGKVDGRACFGIDVRVPSMLYAVIARCPTFGGRLDSWQGTAAGALPGVVAVFPVMPLPRRYNTAGGIAVVATSTWAALQGRKALVISWDKGTLEGECSSRLKQAAESLAAAPAKHVAIDRGDALRALENATTKLEASYTSSFQAHATMEPMNTTVHVREDAIEVWSPTQFAEEVQSEIAALAAIDRDRVIVHTLLSGGSFGRRYQWDYAAEAWQVANVVRGPVQLIWTREDDLQHDFYRPYNHQRLTAALNSSGQLVAWYTRIVTTPIAGTNLYTDQAETPRNLRDPATIAELEWFGADIAPYSVPNCRVDYVPMESMVPRSWWRSVSSSYTVFARECFLDEVARAARLDPLQFRLGLLPDATAVARRLRAALLLLESKARWHSPLGAGLGRGVACRSGDTVSAQVAEVKVEADGTVRVLRVISVVDCGIAVNPDGVRAMTEGAINFGLTAVLNAEITVRDGSIEQSNFHDYRVLRLNEAPEIEVHIVPSDARPSGVGELGVMLIGPAVVNAIFDATGVRIRRLPVERQLLARSERASAESRN
ncbi:MAG TPA: molybdopterin cofactor-binding domain-containing protein [Steroidobacteraceae bacterium]|nr:molybdopterin cofactor-binding domain-containing protein [Steroidobacteraceae bacterium]